MKVMLAFNGSTEAKAALDLVKTYARLFDAKVFIITSMEGGAGEKPNEITQVTQNLDYAQKIIENEGLECEAFQIARGLSPGEDLVKFAEENEIDHIFVGIQKKSKTRKILLGSTAQYVILKANCPVTTVK